MKILFSFLSLVSLGPASVWASDPPPVRDPFNVTWYGRCGEDDLKAGRDTIEEMQRLVQQAKERAAQLAKEASEQSCKEGVEAAGKRGAIKLAAEANERICNEAVEAAAESVWKRFGRKCGFFVVGVVCAQAIVAEAVAECALEPTQMGDAEWPPRNSCEGMAKSLHAIVVAEMELRQTIAQVTKNKELAEMTVARLSNLPNLTLLQETELKSAKLSLGIAQVRLKDLFEKAYWMELHHQNEKEWYASELARCNGGVYPDRHPQPPVLTPTPIPDPLFTAPPVLTPTPTPTPTIFAPPVRTPTPTPTPTIVAPPLSPGSLGRY